MSTNKNKKKNNLNKVCNNCIKNLYVKTSGSPSKLFTFNNIYLSMTIADLFNMIKKQNINVPVGKKILLIYNGIQLINKENTLQDYNIIENSTIHLVIKDDNKSNQKITQPRLVRTNTFETTITTPERNYPEKPLKNKNSSNNTKVSFKVNYDMKEIEFKNMNSSMTIEDLIKQLKKTNNGPVNRKKIELFTLNSNKHLTNEMTLKQSSIKDGSIVYMTFTSNTNQIINSKTQELINQIAKSIDFPPFSLIMQGYSNNTDYVKNKLYKKYPTLKDRNELFQRFGSDRLNKIRTLRDLFNQDRTLMEKKKRRNLLKSIDNLKNLSITNLSKNKKISFEIHIGSFILDFDDIRPSMTITELINKFKELYEVSAGQKVLMSFNSTELTNEEMTLSDYNITNGSTVIAVVKTNSTRNRSNSIANKINPNQICNNCIKDLYVKFVDGTILKFNNISPLMTISNLIEMIKEKKNIQIRKKILLILNSKQLINKENTLQESGITEGLTVHCVIKDENKNTPPRLVRTNTFGNQINTPPRLVRTNTFGNQINTPPRLVRTNTFGNQINTPPRLVRTNTFETVFNNRHNLVSKNTFGNQKNKGRHRSNSN
jgi:uncharacterized ubiquitin-like protein YukD